ncbi:hypothetical protein QBC32DRAFT_225624, partial [Pseudoneurospora amorphoporcata]
SKTLDISNLENEEALNNVEEAIAAIVKYYSKEGYGPSFTFRPLTVIRKEY